MISDSVYDESLKEFFSAHADDLTALEYSRRILLKLTCSFSVFRVSHSEFHKNHELFLQTKN